MARIQRVPVEESKAVTEQPSGNSRGGKWKRNNDRRGPRSWTKGKNANANTSEENPATPSKPTSSSLVGAKSVIRNKLAVMYRGMRGLDAAEEAFRLCNVEVELNMQGTPPPRPQCGKRKRPFKGKKPQKENSNDEDQGPKSVDNTQKKKAETAGTDGGQCSSKVNGML